MTGRRTYLGVTLLLSLLALSVVWWARGAVPVGITAGVLSAWAVQGVSFWKLVEALDRGVSAVRVWVGGIAARASGLVLAVVAGALWPVGGGEVPFSYGVTLLVLLLLEAVWLSRRGWRKEAVTEAEEPPRTKEARPDDTGTP